ncbi:MAG TPA: class I SAM-dependent methyltransferase [Pseudonocardiaceae bacterium]|jgi:predicted O-methyltransferase YrrM|nr:class I SAM-dependent methyltransferase [Pseudonocardiaceae bacterium]
MSIGGTAAYQDISDLPHLVATAVELAAEAGFEFSCRPAQGRLLRLLAAGVTGGVIGETGTGCGVGLAWLASAAGRDVRLVSVERDADRHAVARELFADDHRVTLVHGGWQALADHGPFDLLVLDGGGQGKGAEPPLDPTGWLTFGGTLVIDDFTPLTDWPPTHDGDADTARLHWLTHPALLATEIRLTAELSTVVARRIG